MGSFVMIVSLFFASLILVPSILAECPEGWWRSGDACYMVSHSRMTWYSAQELCWSLGGYLAEIEDQEQETHLDNFLGDGRDYWLGLNDLAQEGTFKWAETHQVAEYTNWASGQPDNGHGSEDCVFKFADSLKWNDEACDGHDAQHVYALCMMKYK